MAFFKCCNCRVGVRQVMCIGLNQSLNFYLFFSFWSRGGLLPPYAPPPPLAMAVIAALDQVYKWGFARHHYGNVAKGRLRQGILPRELKFVHFWTWNFLSFHFSCDWDKFFLWNHQMASKNVFCDIHVLWGQAMKTNKSEETYKIIKFCVQNEWRVVQCTTFPQFDYLPLVVAGFEKAVTSSFFV